MLLAAPAPESPVADAAQRGDLETVRTLLQQGADVNAAQGDGMTALHWAAKNGDVAMLRVLLYAGANREAATRLGGYTPLHLASQEGASDAVRMLLEAGSNATAVTSTGASAIHFAAAAGQPDAIKALLERGANVNARDAYAGRTPLMFAAAGGRLEAMKTLLNAGADPSAATHVVDYAERSRADDVERRRRARLIAAANEPGERERSGASGAAGEPPLQRAQAPDPDSATAPREQRRPGRPQAEPDSPTAPDSTRPGGGYGPRPLAYEDWVGRQGGLTALHYAARDGRMEAVRLLQDAGADIDQVTLGDHTSPLLIAVINGNYDLALQLLERGADPTLASEDGAAPLFATVNCEWALRTWYPQPTAWQQQRTTYLELMEALLKAGADPNARVKTHIWYAAYNAGRMGVDYSGATAFWRAAYATDLAAMRLLAKYGADPNIPTIKPPEGRFPGAANRARDSTEAAEKDLSGLPPVPVGGPAVHPLHAASGVGYGTSRVGQQHRHVPGGWLPAVRYLVEELGVEVNVRDHEGYTAVHHAAARGDNEMITYLVSRDADVTLVSRRGQTTVDMANGPQQRVQPFPATIALLEDLGAKNNHKCQSCE
ncbi:MAG: ankyrin repeat domain-containing protein [Gemmatimonadetes bacterium]|nr:ankyrin repeat domain-containing protein [Gemmatimonadota bacterium]